MDRLIRYTLITLTFLFVIVFITRPAGTCGDIWFHLKTGEVIVSNHAIPVKDVFSYTADAHEWIDSHWLFQAVLYLCYRILGINGLSFLQLFVLLPAFILLFRTGYDRRRYMVSLVFLLLVVFMANERYLVRPEMVTFLFTALYMHILYNYKYKNSRAIWLLPLLQIIWVNMHGLNTIGLVIVFSFLAGELISWKIKLPFGWSSGVVIRDRKYYNLLIVAAALLAACFFNPYGIRGAMYPFLIFTEIGKGANEWMRMVAELKPSLFSSGDELAVVLYKLAMLITFAGMLLNIKRITISTLILFIGMLYISLIARRNMPLFAFIAMPITIKNINEWLDTFSSTKINNKKKKFNLKSLSFPKYLFLAGYTALVVVFVAGIVSGTYYQSKRSLLWCGAGVIEEEYPSKAIDFIKQNNINGNIYNDGAIGGYIIWKCAPERKVFIDGRWEVYGDAFLLDYWKLINRTEGWNSLVKKYGINYTLLKHSSSEAQRFIPEIYNSKDWSLVYLDGIASVFVKRTSENSALINKYEIDFKNYIAPGYTALTGEGPKKTAAFRRAFLHQNVASNFYKLVGLDENSENEYKQALQMFPAFYEIYNSLGVLYQKESRWDEAAKAFETAVRLKPVYAEAYCNYGNMLFRRGLYEQAAGLYRKAITVKHSYAPTYFNLGILNESQGRTEEAVNNYKSAIKNNPFYSDAYNNLALTYKRKGMNKEEVRMYEKAIESNMYYFNAHYNLAMSYSGNNWSRMAEELRKAEEINPDFKELHYNLGIACENTGDSGNAINEYEKEIEINPEYASSYKNVGILYYSRGDKKKTVYNWKKYLQLNPVAPDAEIIKAEIKKLNNINSR